MDVKKVNKMCKTTLQEEIEALMSLYHLGKAPLSYALGFGEVTITRYLQETMKRWVLPLRRQSIAAWNLNHNSPVQKRF